MMARKRSPEYDYICQRCGCPCDQYPEPGGRQHLGGGSRNMKACKGPAVPILRSEYEAEIKAIVQSIRDRRL